MIDLRVMPSRSKPGVEVRAVVDTGFSGDLTLPAELVSAISLPERGFVDAELADGTIATFGSTTASSSGTDGERRVLVCQTDGGALVGMSLLRDSTLTMEIVPGGQVTIADHSEPST